MSEIIRQIIRTAFLCGSLGLLLYLVLSFAVESPRLAPLLPPVLALVASGVVLFLSGQILIMAWRTGEFPEKLHVIRKEQEPTWFWSTMIWYGAVSLCLLALLLYSVSQLMEIWSSMSDPDLEELRTRLLQQKDQ